MKNTFNLALFLSSILCSCSSTPIVETGGASSSSVVSSSSSLYSSTESSTVSNTSSNNSVAVGVGVTSAGGTSGVVADTITNDCYWIQTQNNKCQSEPAEGFLHIQTAVYAVSRNGKLESATNGLACVGNPPDFPNVSDQDDVDIVQVDGGIYSLMDFDVTAQTVAEQQAADLVEQIHPPVLPNDCVAFVGAATGNRDQYGANKTGDAPATAQWFFCRGNCTGNLILQCSFQPPKVIPNTECHL